MTGRPTLRKRRNLGELISDSFSLLFGDLPALFQIAAPALLIGLVFQLLQELPDEDDLALLSLISLVSLPFVFVAQLMVTTGVAFRLTALDQGKESTAGDAFDAVQERLGPLALAQLKVLGIILLIVLGGSLVSLAGLILGPVGLLIVIPALGLTIYHVLKRAIAWLFIVHCIQLGDETSATALECSAGLVKGEWWHSFGRSAVAGMVMGIPAIIVSVIIDAAIPGVPGILLSALPDLFSYSYLAVALTLMYYDLKTKKAEPGYNQAPSSSTGD